MKWVLLALLCIAGAIGARGGESKGRFAPIVIPLTVSEGDLYNRDSRVFSIPVECAGEQSQRQQRDRATAAEPVCLLRGCPEQDVEHSVKVSLEEVRATTQPAKEKR